MRVFITEVSGLELIVDVDSFLIKDEKLIYETNGKQFEKSMRDIRVLEGIKKV